jgi:hypothetical protein
VPPLRIKAMVKRRKLLGETIACILPVQEIPHKNLLT